MALLSLGTTTDPHVLLPVQTQPRFCDIRVGGRGTAELQHPFGLATATEMAAPGAAQELLQALVQGVSLLMSLLTLGHSFLDLSHATLGAFDAVATF